MSPNLSQLSVLLEGWRSVRWSCCLVLLTVAFGLTGCTQTKTQILEPSKQIVGLWEDSAQRWIFHPDGTFRIDELERGSGDVGTWRIENQILKLHYGFGSTGFNETIPIHFADQSSLLIFDGKRELSRNPEAQKQYNKVSGRLNPSPTISGGQ